MDLNIIEQTPDIIVCVKPSGIPVQTKRIGEQDMESILKNLTRGEIYVVHRLDQPVEGITVWARNKRSAADLGQQITEGSMIKMYMALVWNDPEYEIPDEGELTDYIKKDGRTNTSFVVSEKDPEGKYSQLKYRVIKRLPDRTLVEIRLITGRHHQIRLQFSHRGWPLVGDRKYGKALVKASKDETEQLSVEKTGNQETNMSSREPLCLCVQKPESKEHLCLCAQKPESKEPLCLCAYKLEFKDPKGKVKKYEITPTWYTF